MSRWTLQMVSTMRAAELAAGLPLRTDMVADFHGVIPVGPTWALWSGGRLLGLGGLEPRGAARSAGWLLVGEGVTARDWAGARRAMRHVLGWAAGRSIKRVCALVDCERKGALNLLRGLGFEAADREGDDIVMTKELV